MFVDKADAPHKRRTRSDRKFDDDYENNLGLMFGCRVLSVTMRGRRRGVESTCHSWEEP